MGDNAMQGDELILYSAAMDYFEALHRSRVLDRAAEEANAHAKEARETLDAALEALQSHKPVDSIHRVVVVGGKALVIDQYGGVTVDAAPVLDVRRGM